MNFIKHLAITLIVVSIASELALIYSEGDNKTDFITPQYPLATYDSHELKTLRREVIIPGTKYKVYEQRPTVLDSSDITEFRNIIRYTDALSLNSNGTLWCSLNMARFPKSAGNDRNSVWLPCPIYGYDLRFIPPFFLFMGLSMFFLYKSMTVKGGKQYFIYLSMVYIFIWLANINLLFTVNGFFTVYSFDPDNFFKISVDIINFCRKTKVAVGVGTAILYIPFILLFNAKSYFDISVVFSVFNYFFSGAGTLLLLLLIANRLSPSKRAIQITGVVAAYYPLLAWILRKGGTWDPNFYSKSIFYLFKENPYSMALYNKSLLLSWNGLSDNIAVFFMVLMIVVALFSRLTPLRYFLVGASLGAAMVVRYPSFIILPAFLFLDIIVNLRQRIKYRFIILNYLLMLLAFLSIFSIQMFDNYLINGNLFSPTVENPLFGGMEEKIINMFRFSNVISGMTFYLKVNFKLFFLSMFLLYLIRNIISSFSLWLWIVIPLIFYSSFNIFYVSEIRYLLIIFPALYCTIGIAGSQTGGRSLLIIAFFLILNFTLTSPESPDGWSIISIPPCFNYLLPAVSSLIMLLFWLKNYGSEGKAYLLFAFFFPIFGTGNHWFIIIAMAVFPVYACSILMKLRLERIKINGFQFHIPMS